ncbi:MAG: flavin reductase family protein, partial [Muricauda sp. TMED12]
PSTVDIKTIITKEGVENASKTELHTLAKQLLEDGDTIKAMAYLLFAESL